MIRIKLFFIYFTIKIVLFFSLQFCHSFPQTDTFGYGGGFNTQIDQFCLGLSPNELHTHRYHRESRRCYRVGDQGPCGRNMKFFAEEDNSVFGQCDCDYLNVFERILIYHEPTRQCYFVMTQGYCRPGYYLSFREKFQPTCVWSTCPRWRWNYRTNKWTEIVLFENYCADVDEPSRYCNTNEVVTFVRNNPFPQCGERKILSPVGHALGDGVSKLSCAAGSRYSTDIGRCLGRVRFGG